MLLTGFVLQNNNIYVLKQNVKTYSHRASTKPFGRA